MTEIIESFTGEYEFLSNFSDGIVNYEGEWYPTVEHAYQAAKTLDHAERKNVQMANSPGQAKRLGQKVTMRADWEDIKIAVMLLLLRQKFMGHRKLRQKLRDTGDAWLIEGNHWYDDFWGDDVRTPRGKNWLGILLMIVRSETYLTSS